MTLLPVLFVGGILTLFIGSAVVFGVWLPQWVANRRLPAREQIESLDDAASTGRFSRFDVDADE
jgi:hypothetical protein